MEGLQENDLLTLVAQYAQEARERDRFVAGLINLYKKEIQKLNDRTTDVLSDTQKKLLQEEIHHLTSHGDENFRSGDMHHGMISLQET